MASTTTPSITVYTNNRHYYHCRCTISVLAEARTATPIIIVHTNTRHYSYYCCTRNRTSDRATILQILKYLIHKKVYGKPTQSLRLLAGMESVDILDMAPPQNNNNNSNGEATIVAGPSMNSTQCASGAAVVDNRIFVVGGWVNGR